MIEVIQDFLDDGGLGDEREDFHWAATLLTLVGTMSFAPTRWLSIASGLGEGFANTDNREKTMQFANGDLGTAIAFGFATPGLPQFERDTIGFSVSYEYNITQKETSLSLDVSFGCSF